MPGSLSNPVVLDPWQAIVEVGWSSIPTHITFIINLGNNNSPAQDLSCDGTVPEPAPPYWNTYVTQAQMEYDNPSSGIVTAIRLRVNGTWGTLVSASAVGVDVSALPSLPSFGFGYFQHVGAGGGTSGFGVSGPALRWTPPTGAELDIPLPSSSNKFLDVLEAELALYSDTFTGSPDCIDGFGTRKYATCTGYEVGVEEPGINMIDIGANHTYVMAGVTGTFTTSGGVGVNFIARGIRLSGGTERKGGTDGGAQLSVLLEREGLS